MTWSKKAETQNYHQFLPSAASFIVSPSFVVLKRCWIRSWIWNIKYNFVVFSQSIVILLICFSFDSRQSLCLLRYFKNGKYMVFVFLFDFQIEWNLKWNNPFVWVVNHDFFSVGTYILLCEKLHFNNLVNLCFHVSLEKTTIFDSIIIFVEVWRTQAHYRLSRMKDTTM
jgi:hypothetical protein